MVLVPEDGSEMAVTKGCQRKEVRMREKSKWWIYWRVSSGDGDGIPFSDYW